MNVGRTGNGTAPQYQNQKVPKSKSSFKIQGFKIKKKEQQQCQAQTGKRSSNPGKKTRTYNAFPPNLGSGETTVAAPLSVGLVVLTQCGSAL